MKNLRKFYVFLSIFFWARALKIQDNVPIMGVPYQRDPDSPCEAYEPFKKKITNSFKDCESDGHNLCSKCIHLKA